MHTPDSLTGCSPEPPPTAGSAARTGYHASLEGPADAQIGVMHRL